MITDNDKAMLAECRTLASEYRLGHRDIEHAMVVCMAQNGMDWFAAAEYCMDALGAKPRALNAYINGQEKTHGFHYIPEERLTY